MKEKERERSDSSVQRVLKPIFRIEGLKITEYFHLKKKNNNRYNCYNEFREMGGEAVIPSCEIITSCQVRVWIRDVDEIERRNVTACVRRRVVESCARLLSTLEPREG